MTRYTVAQARANLSRLLDLSEQGSVPVIERRGVRFAVSAIRTRRRAKSSPSPIAWMSPALADGQWRWEWGPAGPRFVARRSKTRR